MTTNVFFDNYDYAPTQELLEDLIIQAIQMYGIDMVYLPRNYGNFDSIYDTDDQSYYSSNFLLEMYLKNTTGFGGDGNFFSKISGLEIRDQISFIMSAKRYNEEIGYLIGKDRPDEGDIIYFPLNKKCFQIKFVNKFEFFYQLGSLNTWEVTCELFEYSDERFNTGIPEIDILQTKFSTNVLDYAIMDELDDPLLDEFGNYLVVDNFIMKTIVPNSDNEQIKREAAVFIDFSEVNPFAEIDLG